MTKMLTGFTPIALLPQSKDYRERIMKAIDNLESEDGLGNNTSRIIEAIIQGILWDHETWKKIEALGTEIGMEMFSFNMQNADPYDIAKSPDNPENWKAKIEVFHNHTRISTVIQAWQAKNGDGSPANWEKGTEEGDRWLTQVKIIPNDHEKPIRYQNYW
jgi:hypothetical protein